MARLKSDDPKVRSKIMEAAAVLFAAHGYTGASIREIATEAGVNGAMIHYYFGSKEKLYKSILETAAVEARALVKQAIDEKQDARKRLRGFTYAYSTYVFTHPNLARIIHREMLSDGKHLKEVLQKQLGKNYAILREIISDGVKSGELRSVNIDLSPFSLIGMIVFFQIGQPVISAVLGKKRYDEEFIKKFSDHTVDLFLHGVEASAIGLRQSVQKKGARKKGTKKPDGKR